MSSPLPLMNGRIKITNQKQILLKILFLKRQLYIKSKINVKKENNIDPIKPKLKKNSPRAFGASAPFTLLNAGYKL